MSKFQNPIVKMEFQQNLDLEVALCAELGADRKLSGVAIYVHQKSSGVTSRTTDFVLKDLFQTKIAPTTKPGVFALTMRPLTTIITVTQKPDKFVAQYAFEEQKVFGVVDKVQVSGTEAPLSLTLTILGNYRKSKDAVPTKLVQTILCPKDFTSQLYEFVKSQ